MNTLLAAIDTGTSAGLRTLLVYLLLVAVIAAFVFFGLKLVGQGVWASRVAGGVIVVGVILILLSLL